jgi:hypothetical protein
VQSLRVRFYGYFLHYDSGVAGGTTETLLSATFDHHCLPMLREWLTELCMAVCH